MVSFVLVFLVFLGVSLVGIANGNFRIYRNFVVEVFRLTNRLE